jgi:hypothetical protein
MDLENFNKAVLDPLKTLITIIGAPVAIFIFWSTKLKERREREYATYNTLDDKYNELLKVCFDNPKLGISPTMTTTGNTALTFEEEYQKQIIFEMLFSILERAYLMHLDKSNSIRSKQWTGWENYIKLWATNADFKIAWKNQGTQWDTTFTDHMNGSM